MIRFRRRAALRAAVPALIIFTSAITPTSAGSLPGIAQGPSASFAVELTGSASRLAFDIEPINDPDVDPLFNRPWEVVVGPGGRLFYLDGGDNDVKVLSPEGEHLFTIGRQGQGPGEFEDVTRIALGPAGRYLYVLESPNPEMEVFDAGTGQHLYRIQTGLTHLNPLGLLVLEDDIVIVVGASLSPEFFGNAIHRLRIERNDTFHWLEHEFSFAPTPDYAPGVYEIAAGGTVSHDRVDGAILFAQAAPYRLAKYTVAGELVWELEDPAALPPPTAAFSVGPDGSVRVGPFPLSYAFLPFSEDYYLHQMFFPPEELRAGDVIGMRSVFELVPRDGAAFRKLSGQTQQPLVLTTAEGEGRFYGMRGTGLDQPVRITLEFLEVSR